MKLFKLLLVLTIWRITLVAGDTFPTRIYVTWWIKGTGCAGGDKALLNTGVSLHYDYTESGITRSEIGPVLTKNDQVRKAYNLSYSSEGTTDGNTTRQAEYYFEQLEHGGGLCNCVFIYMISTELVE